MSVVNNRFELSVLSGYRAKELSRGIPVTIAKNDNDKNTVTALREIAEGGVLVSNLRNLYVRSLQKNTKSDDVLEEDTQNIAAELMETSEKYHGSDSKIQELSEEEQGENYISVDDYSLEDDDDSGA